jgi:hypothetical protein
VCEAISGGGNLYRGKAILAIFGVEDALPGQRGASVKKCDRHYQAAARQEGDDAMRAGEKTAVASWDDQERSQWHSLTRWEVPMDATAVDVRSTKRRGSRWSMLHGAQRLGNFRAANLDWAIYYS